MAQKLLTRGYIPSDGDLIYYESAGEGAPLVLCHGASGNHATWYKQVGYFSDHRRVITWDHRGFGLSSMAVSVARPKVSIEDLRRVLDAVGAERVDLVAQSMGGWTAVGFALAYPERVRSLILTGTTGGVRTPRLKAAWDELMARPRGEPRAEILGASVALGEAFIVACRDEAVLYQALGAFNRAPLPEVLAYLGEEMNDAAAVNGFAAPTLVLAGEADTVFPTDQVWEAAQQFPAAQTRLIAAAGHSSFFEAADAWNSAVKAFLSNLD